MNMPKNGAPVAGPPQPQLLINVVEVAPGIVRFHMQFGPVTTTLDLPKAISKQVAQRWVSEIEKTESSILIAPPGAVPGLSS